MFTIKTMNDQVMEKKSDVNLKKMMGWNYLNRGRLEEAAEVFTQSLNQNPAEIDSLLMLANLYLASGDRKMSGMLHQRAFELDPHNPSIIKSLIAEPGNNPIDVDSVPTDAKAVAHILGQLTGQQDSVNEEDVTRVANLIQRIITSDSPAKMVNEHLDEIDELLPALIEVNIRQAEADGKFEIAAGLKDLQENIVLQMEEEKAQNPEVIKNQKNNARKKSDKQFSGKVLFLQPQSPLSSGRVEIVQDALRNSGCQVNVSSEFAHNPEEKPEVAVVSYAHVSPKIMEGMASLSALSIPMILDLDQDFEHMPVTHQSYSKLGLSSPARARAYATTLVLANQITVNSNLLAQALSYQSKVIPDTWSKANPLWTKAARPRDQIHIGWLNTSGQIEDLAAIRRGIIRITREFPNTQIFIIGDPQAYRLFDSVPDHRRTFLPEVESSEFPYQLSQVDILLVPVHNSPYHSTISDRILMTAGVKGIPWIASPIPSFKEWPAGGLIADDMDEWYMALRQLVMDEDLRKSLSENGKKAAQEREITKFTSSWLNLIEGLLASRGDDSESSNC
jgi:tetratricopeptide (TPR) repeat protein